MSSGDPTRGEEKVAAVDPAALAVAVRELAMNAHRAFLRAASGHPDHDPKTLQDLMRRIIEIHRALRTALPDEPRLDDLRLWLSNLQQQVVIVRHLEDLRIRVERLERLSGLVPANPETGPGPEFV